MGNSRNEEEQVAAKQSTAKQGGAFRARAVASGRHDALAKLVAKVVVGYRELACVLKGMRFSGTTASPAALVLVATSPGAHPRAMALVAQAPSTLLMMHLVSPYSTARPDAKCRTRRSRIPHAHTGTGHCPSRPGTGPRSRHKRKLVVVVPETKSEKRRAGKKDDEEVNDELGDLERGEISLPLYMSAIMWRVGSEFQKLGDL